MQNTADTFSPSDQPPINDTTILGSQQVNIRVRFAEVSRDDVQRLGIGSSGGSIAFGGGGGEVDALVGALQRNGMLTILAEPNLTAATGRPASFLAGGEIPIPVPGNQAGQITVQYKPFGVSLEFTPTLVRTNRIGLRVRPEVSSLSRMGAIKTNGVDLPSLMVRRADTTVEVASGQTFAIAGLFQRQMSTDYEATPEIADLPILGALFRSARYRRDETELVILITPYLVKPVRDRGLATPLDRPAPPLPPGRLSSKPSSYPSQIPALCSNDPSRVHDAAYVRRLPLPRCSGVGPRRLCGPPPYPKPTVYWGTFPQQPPDYSPDYASVPVVGRNGRTRYVLVPKACLAPDPTEPPFLGPHLPPGCANAYNLQRMAERQSDLVRGRPLGAAPAAPTARAAQEYIYGAKDPLGGGLPRMPGAGQGPGAQSETDEDLLRRDERGYTGLAGLPGNLYFAVLH